MPQQFSCGQCGKTYAWKPELAGKKVRCACGHVMTAPQAPAPPAQPEKEDLYDLADDPTPTKGAPQQAAASRSSLPIDDEDEMPVAPLKNLPKARPATLPPNPPTQSLRPAGAASAAASAMRAYPTSSQRPGAKDDLHNAVGGSPVTELYVPAILLGVGLMLFALSHMYQGGSLQSFASVMPAIGLGLLFNLLLSFAGIFMVARIWEVSFGAPGPAILKLCVCAILPAALATLIGEQVGSDSRFVAMSIRSTCMMPLTLFCFMFLFRLAIDEAFYCMVVIYLINEWVIRFLLLLILAHGSAGGLSSTMGGTAPNTPSGRAYTLIQQNRTRNGMEWAKGGSHGLSYACGREAVAIVQKLLDAGAKDVQVTVPPGESLADSIIIEMPRGKEKRQAVFTFAGRVAKRFNITLEGQTADDAYLFLDLPSDLPEPLKLEQKWD